MIVEVVKVGQVSLTTFQELIQLVSGFKRIKRSESNITHSDYTLLGPVVIDLADEVRLKLAFEILWISHAERNYLMAISGEQIAQAEHVLLGSAVEKVKLVDLQNFHGSG